MYVLKYFFGGLLCFFVLLQKISAQNYIPHYLSVDNEFIQQHFDVFDSSGWFIALPDAECFFQQLHD